MVSALKKAKQHWPRYPSKAITTASLNPKAHLRREITVEDVLNAPMIAWPLGLFDSCGVSDGSAAAIRGASRYGQELQA